MFPKLTRKQRQWFKNLWDANANEYEFFELAKDYRPDVTWEAFDHGWQWTTVLNENYPTAVNEFILCAYDAV